MRKPQISIITVTYNCVDTIEKTIMSVNNQVYNNIEYIVIDGGSTDGTVEKIKKHSDKISLWVSEKDKGIYDAMNKGIRMSHGIWLIMLNAGDTFANDNVLNDIFAQNIPNSVSVIFSDYYTRDKKGNVIKCPIDMVNKPMSFNHQNTIYRRELHNEYGMYVVTPKIIISDVLFFYSIPKEKIFKTDTVISFFETGGISSQGTWSEQQWLCLDVVYRKRGFWSIFPLYIWKFCLSLLPLQMKFYLKKITKRVY